MISLIPITSCVFNLLYIWSPRLPCFCSYGISADEALSCLRLFFLPRHWTVRLQVLLQVSSSPQSNSPAALYKYKRVQLLCKTQAVGLFSFPLPAGSWTLTPVPCSGTQTTATDRGESQGALWLRLEGPAAERTCGCEDLPHPGLCCYAPVVNIFTIFSV